jgi:hypothetical protein
MDYAAMAKESGCLDSATEDVIRRCEAKFGGEEGPSPQAVQEWLSTTLRAQAAHLFPHLPTTPWEQLGMERVVWESLSPSTKLALARQLKPQTATPPHPRRPVPRDAPEDVQEGWKDLSAAERLTAYRQWRDEAHQG